MAAGGRVRTLRHQLTAFLVTSGGALALISGAKRFSNSGDLAGWLRTSAMVFFVGGCVAVGLWMLSTGTQELRRVGAARSGPALPVHLRPSRPRAMVSLLFGAILGIFVPAIMLFGFA